MAAADALVLLAFLLIVSLLGWLFYSTIRKTSRTAVYEAQDRAARAEAAITAVEAYVKDHYVEPEVQVIKDILVKHGFIR